MHEIRLLVHTVYCVCSQPSNVKFNSSSNDTLYILYAHIYIYIYDGTGDLMQSHIHNPHNMRKPNRRKWDEGKSETNSATIATTFTTANTAKIKWWWTNHWWNSCVTIKSIITILMMITRSLFLKYKRDFFFHWKWKRWKTFRICKYHHHMSERTWCCGREQPNLLLKSLLAIREKEALKRLHIKV